MEFKKGDLVFDIRYGWGVITDIGNLSYPIDVDFNGRYDSYTIDGKDSEYHATPILSHTEYYFKNKCTWKIIQKYRTLLIK